jgi:hypothetical protein
MDLWIEWSKRLESFVSLLTYLLDAQEFPSAAGAAGRAEGWKHLLPAKHLFAGSRHRNTGGPLYMHAATHQSSLHILPVRSLPPPGGLACCLSSITLSQDRGLGSSAIFISSFGISSYTTAYSATTCHPPSPQNSDFIVHVRTVSDVLNKIEGR